MKTIILASCSYTTSFIWTNVEYSSTTRDTSKRPLAIVLACISMIRWLWQIFSVTEWLSPYKRRLNMPWHFSIVVFVYFLTFFCENPQTFHSFRKKTKKRQRRSKRRAEPMHQSKLECLRVWEWYTLKKRNAFMFTEKELL